MSKFSTAAANIGSTPIALLVVLNFEPVKRKKNGDGRFSPPSLRMGICLAFFSFHNYSAGVLHNLLGLTFRSFILWGYKADLTTME
jgi:hypothetical protein